MSATASDAPLTEGGLLHAIVGTVYLVFFASVVSTPIGILTALYIVEVKGKFAGIVRFFVQAMSGVPSIVAGLFIYAVWLILSSRLVSDLLVELFGEDRFSSFWELIFYSPLQPLVLELM